MIHNETGFLQTEHTPSTPKYPDIEVQLSDRDGNAFAIIGGVRLALRRGGVQPADIEAFTNECEKGNYDHMLQTVMRTVIVS